MQTIPEQQLIELIKKRQPVEATLEDGSIHIRIDEYVPSICAAIHHGHQLRQDIVKNCRVSDADRRFEEDPITGDFITSMPISITALDSRYEYDLNRDPDSCIYETAWEKSVWKKALTEEQRQTSLDKHSRFYRIIHALIKTIENIHGSCIIYDVHSYNYRRIEGKTPVFNIGTEQIDMPRYQNVIRHFATQLRKIELPNLEIQVLQNAVFYGRGYLARYTNTHFKNTLVIPLEIKKIYCDSKTLDPFPLVISALKAGLTQAISRNASYFSKKETTRKTYHHSELLPGILEPNIIQVDRQLARLARGVDTLLYINPINLQQEKRRFFALKGRYNPQFRYRQLNIDPFQFKEKLYRLPVDEIRDPTLQKLYREIIDGLANKIEMITTIGTENFLYNSLRYHGEPSADDISNARFLAYAPALHQKHEMEVANISAADAIAFFVEANKEYGFNCKVELSTRILAGAMVNNSRKTVMINKNRAFTPTEIQALINHEIGVHMVTSMNAQEQPLKLFRFGMPGETETQEGLAILSEYLSGNLTLERLKTLALRVLAVDLMIRNRTFSQTYQKLVEAYNTPPENAFDITARIYRGGGFTKDFVYLRGFRVALDHYHHRSTRFNAIFVGKTSFDFIDDINELITRKLINKPRYLPAALKQHHSRNPIIDYLVRSIR